MTYFDVFQIPVSFFPDQDALRKQYYRLSREFHPDLGEAGQESERLQQSSQLNEAYRTLSNFESRVAHILKIEGVLNDTDKQELSPDFLMEMMEYNEELMEARMEGGERADTIRARILEKAGTLRSEWEAQCREYDRNPEQATLQSIKEYYFRNRYLNRLLEQITD